MRLFATLLVSICALACNSERVPPSPAPSSQTSQAAPPAEVKPKLPEGVSVYKDVVSDTATKTQVSIDLLVGEGRSEADLRLILDQVYTEAWARKGFSFHPTPTHLLIRAYPTKEHAEAGMAQWLAQLSRIGVAGEPQFELAIAAASIAEVPADTSGLSEAQRKAIWVEVVQAEDRAMKETKNLPSPQRWDKNDELAAKYRAAVLKKHGLSKEQFFVIQSEGLAKNWVFPKY